MKPGIVALLGYQPARPEDEGRPEELVAFEALGADLAEAGWSISTGTFAPAERALVAGASHVDPGSVIVVGAPFGGGMIPRVGRVARVVRDEGEARRRHQSGEIPLPYSELTGLAERAHPHWGAISRVRRETMARNVGILRTPWGTARALIAWPGARPRPLTCAAEHGLALAGELGIESLDLREAARARPEEFRRAVWRILDPSRTLERERIEDLGLAA